MKSLLIADTTRAEREQIVADSIGNLSGLCDGCSPGIIEMYQDYIDGKTELREINGIEVLVYHLTDDTDGAPGIGYVVADGDRFTEIIFWYADMNAAETARAIMETIRIKE